MSVEITDTISRLRFLGWHDKESYNGDRPPVAGAVKEYYLTALTFEGAIGLATVAPAGAPISAEILLMTWAVALGTADTGGVSFFATATNIPV